MSLPAFRSLSSIAIGALLLASTVGAAHAADPFTLTSPSFKDGDKWPSKYADSRPNPQGVNACGAGENVAPALAWANAPANAKSFAVMMIDTDGGNGTGAIHWVAYGIPASKTAFAEGEASKPANGWIGGNNGRAETYSGPCPPAGGPHTYVITMVATDIDPATMKPAMTRDDLIAALRGGHALASSSIVAKYSRPAP